MLSNRTKTLLLPFFGTILSCSSLAFEPDEVPASQSFSLQIEDVGGSSFYHRTRPSFGAYASRSAIRLQDGRVLVAGGYNPLLEEFPKKAEVFDPKTEKWTELPPMHNPHVGANSLLLEDGRVVILGGFLGVIDTPEIFDPKTEKWTLGEQLASPIWADSVPAALLDNGKVLVASGYFDSMAYFFDSNTLTWTPAPPMKYSRIYHSLTLLQDGRVLATGGKGINQASMLDEDRLITEIFDPKTNKWSDAASLNAPHSGHLASLLDDGRVLLVDLETTQVEIFDPQGGPGGSWSLEDTYGDQPRLYPTLTSLSDGRRMLVGGYVNEGVEVQTLVYSPDNGVWETAGKLKTSRQELTATLLENGRVLIAGGMLIDSSPSAPTVRNAELFVPNEPSVWQALEKQADQLGNHTSTRLNDGRVLLSGFSKDLQASFLFLPETNSFLPTASLMNPRARAESVLLDDGRVMIAGGISDLDNPAPNVLSSVEFYDPKTEQWSVGPNMNQSHYPPFMARLPDGRVLVGSRDDGSLIGAGVEIFDPVLGTWTLIESLSQPNIRWANVVVLSKDQVLFSGYQNKGVDGFVQVFDLEKGPSEPIPIPDFIAFGTIESFLLHDGRILIQSAALGSTSSKMGFFDPATKTWRSMGVVPVASGPANFFNDHLFWAAANWFPQRSAVLAPEDESFTLVDSPYASLWSWENRTTPLVDGRMLVTGATFMGYKEGAYLYGKSVGGACSGSFECTSGHCVDGFCCNEACDDDDSCNTCARARGADADGTCTKLLSCAPYQCNRIDIVPDGQNSFCTANCSRAADCATGYACSPDGFCEEPKNIDIDNGCMVVPSNTKCSASWWLIIAGLSVSRLRRKTSPDPSRRRSKQPTALLPRQNEQGRAKKMHSTSN